MALGEPEIASLSAAWASATKVWARRHMRPIGVSPPVDLVVATCLRIAATLIKGAKDPERLQLASDGLEMLALNCGVSSVEIMKYRLEAKPEAMASQAPQGSA